MVESLKKLAKRTLPKSLVHRLQRKGPEAVILVEGQRPSRGTRNRAPYYFTPLENPTWVDPAEATYLVEDDAVIGFEVDGQAYAIPWDVIAKHHVANVEINDHHYVVTLCDACISGGVFDAEIDGTPFRFRMDGMYNGTPYAVDEQTGSLWIMVTMQPIYGRALEIGKLRRMPMVHADWSEWKHLHPDTVVVHAEGEPEDGHGGDHRWAGHGVIPSFAWQRMGRVDHRLDPVDVVAGVVVEGEARCYPLELVHRHGGIVNDAVKGRPVAVISVPGSYLAVTLFREVAGEPIELSWAGGVDAAVAAMDLDSDDEPLLVDDQTGSKWNLLGNCIEGARKGERLEAAWGGLEKWFGWSNLNEGTGVWGVDAELGGDGDSWSSTVRGGLPSDERSIEFARRGPGQPCDHDH